MNRRALLMVVAVLLGACGLPSPSGPAAPASDAGVVAPTASSTVGPSTGSATPTPTAPSTSPSSAGPSSSAGTGTIAWNTAAGFEVASLVVPRDYADPSGATIKLLLIKRPAGDPTHRIGTLLVNPGGPGGSGADMVRQNQIGTLPQAVLDRFDIIGWDPRGVGASTHVDCPDSATIKRIEALDPAPTTKAAVQANVDAYRAVATECAAASGPLLPFLSTDETARDMEAIRAAIGEDRVSYYGVSYGTFLGARYATLFPDHLRAAVLDGAIDPSLDFLGRDIAQARGFEAALARFFAACKADKACEFHGGGSPAKAFDALMSRIRRAPIKTSSGVSLGPGQAFFGVLAYLYASSFDPLAHALAAAERGDGDPLVEAADGYMAPNEPTAFGSYLAISCLDTKKPTDRATIEATYRQVLKVAPRLGAFIALDFSCLAWPADHAPLPPTKGVGLPPIVVLGSTVDPATPYAEAAKLADALGSGVVLTRVGIGHTALGGGLNDCLKGAVERYLVDLVPPPVGTTCPDGPITFSK